MNRRKFFKFLGIGAATAVAPNMLAEIKSETYPECNGGNITLKMLQDAYAKAKINPPNKLLVCLDGIKIYEEPKHGYDYSIGVDVGNGLNTSSCISVMRKGLVNEPDVQAAEFVSGTHTPSSLVPVIAAIAEKYGVGCTDPRGPLLVIEQVSSSGDVTQHQLKLMGFTRFYEFVQYRKNRPLATKSGWYSNVRSRPILMARFNDAVSSGKYQPKSSSLTGNTEEVRGNPRFMAAALSYIGLNGMRNSNV